MVIISDAMMSKSDEGCIKIASTLAKRLKKQINAYLITYKFKSEIADIHFDKVNKLFIDRKLIKTINSHSGKVIYIPISSNTKAGVIRSAVLSLFCKEDVAVIFTQLHKMDKFTEQILRKSKVEVIALSREAFEFYKTIVKDRAIYLKTGIDVSKFVPVTDYKKRKLKIKYGLSPEKKVVLHVGHLKAGRNVDKLSLVENENNVILVLSSNTAHQQDEGIRQLLSSKPNVKIIDTYIENIEEIYQLSDAYLFPVMQRGNCIDIPLSVLEAAACNVPIVCTSFGELKEFENKPGFIFIDKDDKQTINDALDKAFEMGKTDIRNAVLDYDWDKSVETIKTKEETK